MGGPFETLRMIVEFGAAEPVGSCATTWSSGALLSTFARLTPKPALCSCALALVNVRPTTYGTETGVGPLETLIRTREPWTTIVPAGGSWPVTVLGGLPEWTEKIFGTSPASLSALSASVASLPMTSGTSTFGFPFETVISTVLFFAARKPATGLWSMTRPAFTVSLGRRVTWATRPASSIFATASPSASGTTFGTATVLFAFSWSWIFVYANQAAPPAAASSRTARIHGQIGRRRLGGPS